MLLIMETSDEGTCAKGMVNMGQLAGVSRCGKMKRAVDSMSVPSLSLINNQSTVII